MLPVREVIPAFLPSCINTMTVSTFDENMNNYKKYHKKAYEIKQIIDEKQSHVEKYINKDDNNQ